MKTQLLSQICISLLLVSTFQARAADQTVLDSNQHPTSPEYESAYPDNILPLDVKLSWKNRFKGDENFNEQEVLENTGSSFTASTSQQQTDAHSGHSMSQKMDGVGVIKQIKTRQGKIKLNHGPIERLGMPAMTMVFKVDDVSQLEGLEKGQEIGFSVDNTSGGFVLTHIMSMPENEMTEVGNKLDATGTVTAIRAGQGKVKIKHGPIEKLGMPAMTMMFKVEKPEMLEGLEKGKEVNFSVDNSSGGFVITDIETRE